MTIQQTILESQIRSTVSSEDMTAESDTENKTDRVFANIKFFRGNKPFESKKTDIACTILKAKEGGMSNLGEDVIIERSDIDNGFQV